jgi:hypothetical protein
VHSKRRSQRVSRALGGLPCLAAVITLAAACPARAAERGFAFVDEAQLLGPGDAELEPWTTLRAGREQYYSDIEQRLGFEFGILSNFEGALAWHGRSSAEDAPRDVEGNLVRRNDTALAAASLALTYKLADRLVDVIGVALRAEGGYGPSQAAARGRLILDEQSRHALFALNLAGEHVWNQANASARWSGTDVELGVAAGYLASPLVVLGLEAVNTTRIDDGEITSSRIHLGPSFGYASERYWFSLAVLPQVFAPESSTDESLDLEQGEYLRARVRMGFRL